MSTPATESPSPQDPTLLPPNPLPAPPVQPKPSTNPRRLPPPCWSHEETIALIDAYRDKWYTLRRGNLKANHWQDVADAVARRCPTASSPKTAVQCRHKMEKLRKRYRTEIQRARSMPLSRFSSSWVHFKRMDAMEKGPQAKVDYNSESGDNEEENENGGDDDDDDNNNNTSQAFYKENIRNGNSTVIHKLYHNGMGVARSNMSGAGSSSSGFRIRIPTGVSIAQPAPTPVPPKFYAKVDLRKYGGNPNPPNVSCNTSSIPKPNYGGGGRSGRVLGGCYESYKKRERESMDEMVAAIKVLGDGFVRMEKMKMEMAREIESMRMEMEMKRAHTILESQQRILEAFAKALSDKKKPKRILSPQS